MFLSPGRAGRNTGGQQRGHSRVTPGPHSRGPTMRLMVDADRPVPAPAGLVLAPFRAARFPSSGPDLAPLTSPPYDVIDDAERAELQARDERNVVRLILPGEDYDGAARTLRAWLDSGVLRRDEKASVYVYEEERAGHAQRGLIGAVALTDPDAGIILPHENTMAGPVSDRLALTRATRANLEPIFLLYAGGGETSRVVSMVIATTPLVETSTDDGVTHRLWAIDDPAVLTAIAADLLPRRAVIADGHHRYATYRQYQAERHAAGDGSGPWDFGLAFLVDATVSGPQVHAIHRVVRGLGLTEAVRRAAEVFTVRQLAGPGEGGTAAGDAGGVGPAGADPDALVEELAKAGQGGHAFVVTNGTAAYLLTEPDADLLTRSLPPERSAAFRGLDVTVAHLALIVDVWGLTDTVGVVDYHHDAPAAIAAAAAAGGTALLLNPTPIAGVTAVAEAGERMPRKSTLFTPKPRTGLVLRPLDD
ncbi:hypothetical protein ThrDRAFT_04112 [Frankia casuarinae]|nr:hypothetical protein CcI6DRAFT_04744 [Frankia sp. CcI6]EYT90267.1 hypothetical protein ThrDRAFT_04112 [Frankia casuarinae]KDA42295.1 hypothetical protein BMG523Draft_02812 [Frankia sp. BMG5.23]KFB05026.1 Protein of unknown function (DUF1015) [Frankia sp. Allo2]OAA18290.1 Protein of unknown function (DUF1015) [Frankia casuarinae]